MKAAILRSFNQPLSIEELPVPQPLPDEVVIRVHACGVCHSDLHLADADWDLLKRHTKLPLILGHEVTGVVDTVGEAVAELRRGDRVGVPWLHWTCGECEYCREGREVLCNKQSITGVTVDGGYAEFVKAKASHCVHVPDGLSSAEAAPLLCAGVTAYRGLKQAGLASGQRVTVYGVGGLGHLAIQIAKAKGAIVSAVDIREDKLELARECGADWAGTEKPERAHVAIVTSASAKAYEAALKGLRKGGTLAVVGMPAEPFAVSAVSVVAGEYRLLGSAVGTRQDLREILALAATGAVRCRHHVRRLDDVNAIFDEMRRGDVAARAVVEFPGRVDTLSARRQDP
ncbi:MAG: alcohol dehydrogenase catalytic domain-containing protein [Bryobacterales bacterium]|nr:alcohol dehydrogenase catalytic domain-containing protein [Bryobacterales bacterium]